MITSKPGEKDFQWKFRLFFWSVFVLLLLILLSLHFFMALAYEQTIEILTRVQSMETTVEKMKMHLDEESGADSSSSKMIKPVK